MTRLRLGLGTERELEPGIPVGEITIAWILMVAGTAVGSWLTGSQSRLSVALAAPLLLLGGLLAIAAVRTMGRSQHLVTEGPYRWVRHPYFLAILVMLLGAIVALRSWPGLILFIPTVTVTVDRARREEHNLAIRFAERYEEYRRLVPFMLPTRPPLRGGIPESLAPPDAAVEPPDGSDGAAPANRVPRPE